MIDFTIETEIERTPAEVFVCVADPAKLATWQWNTVSAVPETDAPLRVRSGIREVHRAPGAKEIEEFVEVAEYEPDRVSGRRNIEGPPVQGRITLGPTERGTRFRFRVCGQPTERRASSNPSSDFILKRNFQHVCTTLKRVLEDARPRPDTVCAGHGDLTSAR